MKPYLAIIYDSFVDAARSRVLWVLLAGWTVILAAIAPFSIIQGTTIEIQYDQILARQELLDALSLASDGGGTKAQQRVFQALDANFQQQIVDRQKKKRGGVFQTGRLANELSRVLDDVGLYSVEAWPTAAKRSEMQELLAKSGSELSSQDLQYRNRRLVEFAFPGTIRSGEGKVIWIGYAGIEVSPPLPFTRKQVQPFFEGRILLIILKYGLGVVGIFIGVIVTSPMIPDLFQVGSLHLLLSKPISRSWLLVSKFIGGTAFIGLNVAYLLVGFYFLVGWRLQIWNSGILLCIPIFIFVFMIYYSVSMLTGLIWRNAIVSIVLTVLFWAFCFTIGVANVFMQQFVTVLPEITRVETIGDTVVAVTNGGGLKIWDDKESKWQDAFGETFGGDSILGPFWIESEESLYFGRQSRMFGEFQSDGIRMQIAKLPELGEQTEKGNHDLPLWSSKRIDSGPEFPSRTRRAIAWHETLVAITERGLFRLDIDSTKANDPTKQFSLFGLSFPLRKNLEAYAKLTPDDWFPESPMDIDYVDKKDFFIVYSRGQLVRLDKEGDDQYEPGPSLDLEFPDGTLALVACNGDVCIIATNKCGVWRVDCETWKEAIRLDSISEVQPRSLSCSPSDRSFAFLGRDGKLWQIAADGTSATELETPYQGKCSAVAIDESGRWWLAHHVRQVDCWDVDQKKSIRSLAPTWSLVERIYYWGVRPLYQVNPKPSAVDWAIQRSLTRDDPMSLGLETAEMESLQAPPEEIWQPIWSNAIFIAVTLAIGCWYMHRQDL